MIDRNIMTYDPKKLILGNIRKGKHIARAALSYLLVIILVEYLPLFHYTGMSRLGSSLFAEVEIKIDGSNIRVFTKALREVHASQIRYKTTINNSNMNIGTIRIVKCPTYISILPHYNTIARLNKKSPFPSHRIPDLIFHNPLGTLSFSRSHQS